MTRTLVLGNSHAAAVKSAYEASEPALEFFAVPSRSFDLMGLREDFTFGYAPDRVARNDRHVHMTAELNGAAEVDLTAYDTILLVGTDWGVTQIAGVIAGSDIDGIRAEGSDSLLSRPAFEATVAAIVRPHLPSPFWGALAQAGVSLILAPRPSYSEACLEHPHRNYASWHALAARPGGAEAAMDAAWQVAAGLIEAEGWSALRQPQDTRGPLGLTLDAFRDEAARARTEGSKRGDFSHMNAEYGVAVLRSLAAHLAAEDRAAA